MILGVYRAALPHCFFSKFKQSRMHAENSLSLSAFLFSIATHWRVGPNVWCSICSYIEEFFLYQNWFPLWFAANSQWFHVASMREVLRRNPSHHFLKRFARGSLLVFFEQGRFNFLWKRCRLNFMCCWHAECLIIKMHAWSGLWIRAQPSISNLVLCCTLRTFGPPSGET